MEKLGFDGRVAIVTGAGNGLGKAYAKALASRGARVLVNDLGTTTTGQGRSDEPAAAVAAEICGAGGVAVANTASVATREGAQSIVSDALDAFGRIDILINNAGIVIPSRILETGLDRFAAHMDVSFHGAIHLTQACLDQLIAHRGNIINVASHAMLGHEDLSAYAAAKGAVWALTRCVALDPQCADVRVNALFPMGSTRTRDASGNAVPNEELLRFVEEGLDVSKVAEVVAYLAHSSCPLSGKALAAGNDRAALVFIAENDGYTQVGLTAEDVRDHLEQVCDTSEIHDFRSFDEYLRYHQSVYSGMHATA